MPLGIWSRWTGLGLGPIERVGRMLSLHRLAFEAERDGRQQRASFFWRETRVAFANLRKQPQVWEAVWETFGKQVFANGEELRRKLALEVLADVHAAFCNGRLGADMLRSADRAFHHLQCLREVLPLADMPAAEQAALLAPAAQAEIATLKKFANWDEAVRRAREQLNLDPHNVEFQNSLAYVYFEAAVAGLSDGARSELAQEEAERLGRRVQRLKEVVHLFPYNPLAYELIGHLENLRAVRLANGGKLAEALVAGRKAQVFHPPIDESGKVMPQLIEEMTKLQTHMNKTERELRYQPNASLTAEGQKMMDESKRGFTLLEQYMETAEPAQIAAGREKALARSLWREIGLPAGGEEWDERAAALVEAAESIFSTEPATAEAISAAFEREAATRPNLAGIDSRAVGAFMERRRAGIPPASEPEVSAPAPEVVSIPIPETAARPAGRDREPFGYWLFGRQDYGARAIGLAAAASVVVLAGAAVADWRGSRVRAEAYDAVVAAARANDEPAAVVQSQRFLAAWTLQQSDPREGHVRTLLTQAQDVPNQRVRNAAVREMQAALANDDGPAVLRAVEKFAGAPPVRQPETRAAQLRDIYAREFVRWFAGHDESAGTESAARAETYRRVTAQLDRMAGGTQ